MQKLYKRTPLSVIIESDVLLNAESGEGYSDILIRVDDLSIGIVIEIKYSESRNLEAACRRALKQIEEKGYAEQLLDEDMTTILKYGIACHKRTCMVQAATA